MEISKESEAYKAGYKAFDDGTECPLKGGLQFTKEYFEWHTGWLDSFDAYIKKIKAEDE